MALLDELNIEQVREVELTEQEMDALVLARYFYKYNDGTREFMSDALYQKVIDKLEKVNPNHTLIKRTWSDDPIPYKILQKYKIQPIEIKDKTKLLKGSIQKLREGHMEEIRLFAEDLLNRSIKLYRTHEDIEKWFNQIPYRTFHASIKADGINYSATYLNGQLVDVQTRSRDGEGIDITYQGTLLLPNMIDTEEYIIKISGEIVLPPRHLSTLRAKYDKPYKTARNSVNSVLLTCDDEDDIKLLMALTFKVKSENLHSLSEEFQFLQDNGFNVLPHATFQYTGYESFRQLFEQFEPLRRALQFGSDGLVVGVDNNDEFYSLGGTPTHFNGNIACKVGVWDATNYKSIVKSIDWTYNTTKITPVLEIEPVETLTGQTVSHINAHHIKRLVELGIEIGSEVSFNYVSDCYVELVY